MDNLPKNTEALLERIDERTHSFGAILTNVAQDVQLIRIQQQVMGGELEHVKSNCIMRHSRVSRDIQTLQDEAGQSKNGITKIRQTWLTVVVICTALLAMISLGHSIWKGFMK